MELKDSYKDALISLRPKGVVWNVVEGSVTDRKLDIQAEAFAKAHKRADILPVEANKKTTNEMLEDWENVYGLSHEGTIEDRLALLNIISSPGRQDPAFYKDILILQGIKADIYERKPFIFGRSKFGDKSICGSKVMIFYWDIIITEGTDEAITNVKKIIEQYNQAHTILTFIDKRGQ